MLLNINVSDPSPYVAIPGVTTVTPRAFGISGVLRPNVSVEADAKFILQFILGIMDKRGRNNQLLQEIHTVLDKIFVQNSRITGMTIVIARLQNNPSGDLPWTSGYEYYTTTNSVHLSKLESYLKGTMAVDGLTNMSEHPLYTRRYSIPGLYELAREVGSEADVWATRDEFEESLVARDIMWRVDDPRARPPEMWAEEHGKVDTNMLTHHPSKRQRLL